MKTARPAFAMVLVLLLIATSSLAIVTILERQAAHTRTVRRHLDRYTQHHNIRGIWETVEVRLGTFASLSIVDLVAQDPHLFDLVLGDGSVLSVSLADGQGKLLSKFNQLVGDEPVVAQAVVDQLVADVGQNASLQYLREVGPLAVSLGSASDEVVRAIANYVKDGNRPDDLVRELTALRDAGEITSAKISTAGGAANLTPQQRARLNQFVVDRPSIWRLDIRYHARGIGNQPGRLLAVLEGTAQIGSRSGAGVAITRILELRSVPLK